MLLSEAVRDFNAYSRHELGHSPRTNLCYVSRQRHFLRWLEQEAPRKSGRSGIGVENYDWYLANVQLVPWTWTQEVALMHLHMTTASPDLGVAFINNLKPAKLLANVWPPRSIPWQRTSDIHAAILSSGSSAISTQPTARRLPRRPYQTPPPRSATSGWPTSTPEQRGGPSGRR